MKHICPGHRPSLHSAPPNPTRALTSTLPLLLFYFLAVANPSSAVFVPYDNCLSADILNNTSPRRIQFIPLFLDAKFDTSNPAYKLSLTVYGNVTGQQYDAALPRFNSPEWQNASQPNGKINNIGTANNYSTLFPTVNVLTYNAFTGQPTAFCNDTTTHDDYGTIRPKCPLVPVFNDTVTDYTRLPSFGLTHDFHSSYAFATLAPTLRVVAGDRGALDVACVHANITPDLGSGISVLLTWLPAIILALKGVATLVAAIWSPWGSSDIFRWSSNYGRDEDLLRLVTPGFGDCLQYIQFVVLTGALTLQYPGFYQPAVSKASWSLLLFNESYVSKGPGTKSLVDGIYVTHGTYGMARMSELIGMSEDRDVWACMAIWLLVIAATVAILCQIGFLGRWIYRTATDTSEGDLRKKNLPFTLGNMVRLLFNFFILPIVALSLYQFVIASTSPTVVVAMAAVLLVAMAGAAIWILSVIIRTKPRTHLFDDMPTVLLYGPLYNTYSDSAARFAFFPVFITVIRGLALGVLQVSGLAQLIVLAICEVILILTLNGFRPFQGQTSMNLYHTSFAVVRLITVFLAIAFLPALGVDEGARGWIGYVILFLHACVLVFGFFLNSAQTLIEVIARACGVGSDARSGAIRGGIFNLRMLRHRQDRPKAADRTSTLSTAAILPHHGQSNGYGSAYGGRNRSMSASSQQLLNRAPTNHTPSSHRMSGLENFSNSGDASGPSPSFEQDAVAGAYSTLPLSDAEQKPYLGIRTDEGPFYRPPRARKATMDTLTTPTSKTNGAFDKTDPINAEAGFVPVYLRERNESSENLPRPDYAVREVDQYYRGQALNDQPTRKLKTGPADPEGPVVQAQSWFQRVLFGVKQSKKKETSKGFEVVRSSRMPPEMQLATHDDVEMEDSPSMSAEPYRDAPAGARPPRLDTHVMAGAARDRSRSPVSPVSPVSPIDDDKAIGGGKGFDFGFGPGSTRRKDRDGAMHPGIRAEQLGRPRPSTDVADNRHMHERDFRVSSEAPSLAPITSVGEINLPSRFGSQRSNNLHDGDIAETAGAQNWLRAVDNLSWNHSNPASRQASVREPVAAPVAQPNLDVTRRISRREPTDGFPAFDSTAPGQLLTPTHVVRDHDGEVRHGSYHRRAEDSITRNSFGASEASQGQIAEIFGDRPLAGTGESDTNAPRQDAKTHSNT